MTSSVVRVATALYLLGLPGCGRLNFQRSDVTPSEDARVLDARVLDARVLDAQSQDGRVLDAQVLDARVLDAQVLDARVLDAQVLDARVLDAQVLDAMSEDGAATDASSRDAGFDAGPTGVWAQQFSTPILWEQTVNSYDESPSLTGDGLELYFVSSRGDTFAGNDVFVSQFAAGSWTTPTSVTEVNFAGQVLAVKVSADGQTLWTVRDDGATGSNVYRSTRANRASPWSTPALADDPNDTVGMNTTEDDFVPALFNGDLNGLIGSRRAGGVGDFDLWNLQRPTLGTPWISSNAALNSPKIDDRAWVSEDGCHLIFMSNRRPNNLDADNDNNLFYAWGPCDGTFTVQRRLDEVNAPANAPLGTTWDEDPTLSADGRLLFFTSNRSGQSQCRLYYATR